MTRLFVATQRLDADHPTLGATAAMIHALASRVDELVVFTGASTITPLPANVRVHSFAAPVHALRGLRYELQLARELGRSRPIGLLAHMSPVYVELAAPLLRPLRVPLLLWFTQQQAGGRLARAERLVDAILSVDARSVPLASRKVRGIGHGIDTRAFPCVAAHPRGGVLRLLSLGRYAEVKRHDLTVRALRRLRDEGIDAALTIHGEEATPADRDVRARLMEIVRELNLAEHAALLGPVPHTQVPALLTGFDVLVNATRGNAADKVVFEAAASCTPVVAASPVFDRLLPAKLRFADPAQLASAIRAAAQLSSEQLIELRRIVETEHSLDHWADAVLACTLARE